MATERYYRVLYECLLDPRGASSSKHTLLLNLLYKALKADPSLARTQAFAKRLLQVRWRLRLGPAPVITSVGLARASYTHVG